MNAIVKREITPDLWNMIERIAPTMQQSRLFNVATAQQAATIMLVGHQLGLPITAAFEFIHIVNNRPTLSPRGALALIIQSGELEELKIEQTKDAKGNPDACSVYMKRKNGISYTASYSMADAARAGLVKPDSGWAKYPERMTLWRSLGFAADVVFPDLQGGMKRADELGADVTADGDVITGSWKVQPQPQRPPIQDLLDQYSAETILAASNGTLPTTQEQCDAVAAILKMQLDPITVEAVAEVTP